MRKGGYLPANCVAVDKEEYEELKKEAELYRMYRRQIQDTRRRDDGKDSKHVRDIGNVL